jgi:hypothetical protein
VIDPGVEPVQHDGVRWYPIGGRWWPSVTSVLGRTKVDGDALAAWKAKPENSTHAAIRRVEGLRDAGAERGHLLNAEIEAWDLRGVKPTSTWGRSVRGVLDDIDVVHGRELPVVHPELGVASRFDLLAHYMCRDVVLDWKTTRKPKRLEWCEDYVQQVASYVAMVPICYPHLPTPEHGVLALAMEEHHLRCVCGWEDRITYDSDCPECGQPTDTISVKGKPAQRHHLDPDQLATALDRFAERCALFHLQHDPPDLPIPVQSTATAAEAAQ